MAKRWKVPVYWEVFDDPPDAPSNGAFISFEQARSDDVLRAQVVTLGLRELQKVLERFACWSEFRMAARERLDRILTKWDDFDPAGTE